MSQLTIPSERIERAILLIRGRKVLLDQDLAVLYGVETRTLVQAVKRNRSRFPKDFMFQLTTEEQENLRSQFVTSSRVGSTVITSKRAWRLLIFKQRCYYAK